MEELSTIKIADVLLPTRQSDGSDDTTLVIRCVTRPDEHQEALLEWLGIALPNQHVDISYLNISASHTPGRNNPPNIPPAFGGS